MDRITDQPLATGDALQIWDERGLEIEGDHAASELFVVVELDRMGYG